VTVTLRWVLQDELQSTTSRKKSASSSYVLFVVCVIFYVLAYGILYLWRFVGGEDPASTAYFYESAPGAFVILIRLVTFLLFVFSGIRVISLTNGPARIYYISYVLIFAGYFMFLPALVVIAAVLPDWMRFRIVYTFYYFLTFLFYAIYSGMTSPLVLKRLWPMIAEQLAARLPLSVHSDSEDPNERSASYNTIPELESDPNTIIDTYPPVKPPGNSNSDSYTDSGSDSA
jgi:hypothetical protein